MADMSALMFHPKIVHVPIALGLLMPLIAGGLLLAWWRKWLPPRAWAIVALLQAALVVSGFVAMQTGEADEDRVERVVAEKYIEAHEEAAEGFVWASVAVLVVMVGATVFAKRKLGAGLAMAATVGTLVVLVLGYRVGHAGGALVYEHGAAQAYVGSSAAALPGAPTGKHDDDD